MPEIIENGNTPVEHQEQPALDEHHTNEVDIETLKQAAKLESANLIAAERSQNEGDIPKIEIDMAPPVVEEDDYIPTNGNGTTESQPEIIEQKNGNSEPESPTENQQNDIAYHIEENNHHNGNAKETDHQNGHVEAEQNGHHTECAVVATEEPELVCPIVRPQETKPEPLQEPEVVASQEQEPDPVISQDQPDLVCSMVRREEPAEPLENGESEAEIYREPVVCEMRAKFTEPKVQHEAPVSNGFSAKKGALNTKLDTASLKQAYEAVRSDQDDTEWAVFKFDGPILTTKATGVDFSTFQKEFGDAERAFAYIRIQTGDEMSKRQKFLLVTWIGPEVSVLQRAKMSTDKAFVKTVVSNFAVELQPETSSEINLDHFVAELDKAGGAHYGTGV